MKRNFILAFLILISSFTSQKLNAQLPSCSDSTGTMIYYLGGSTIMRLNPAAPLVAGVNPISTGITCPGAGLAIMNNLNAAAPSPTFYTTVSSFIYYYNGATWVNTGHGTGNASAVNIGGGGAYLYNLVGATGQVYRYDGLATATLLLTIPTFTGGGPYDVSCDCNGNFYILRTTTPQWMNKYSPTGVLLQTYTLTGAPSSAAGGGFGVVGNNVYYHNGSGYLAGTISGTNVAFTLVAPSSAFSPSDFASCPGGALTASIDTAYYCGKGPGVVITASGASSYTWTVLSGSATISGSGSSVTLTAPSGISLIELSTTTTSCGTGKDTIVLVVPSANVDAGLPRTFGCTSLSDTLFGSVTGTTPSVNYLYSWTPAANVLSGGGTLNPIITSTSDTTFYFLVSTPPNQGGCTWIDSVNVTVKKGDVDIQGDTVFCGGGNIPLSINMTGMSGSVNWFVYSGSAGSVNPTVGTNVNVSPTVTSKYIAKINSTNVCKDRDTITVYVPKIDFNLPKEEYLDCGDSTYFLNPTFVNYENIFSFNPIWTAYNGTVTNPNSMASNAIVTDRKSVFTLELTSVPGGCKFIDSIILFSNRNCEQPHIIVPTAFTPNGDTKNDVIRPYGDLGNVDYLHFMIYNRWGQKVFTTNKKLEGWNGTFSGNPCDVGTYFWVLTFKTIYDKSETTWKGDFILLR